MIEFMPENLMLAHQFPIIIFVLRVHDDGIESDTLSLFLEAYGLHPGAQYTMHVGLTRQRSALVRLLKGHKEAVTLTETLAFPAVVGQVRRGIALQGLDPGTYQLEVKVDDGRQSVTRRRTLVIEKAGG